MDEYWLQPTLRNQSHPSRDIQRKCHTDIVTGNKHKSHCMSYAGRPNFEQMMLAHKHGRSSTTRLYAISNSAYTKERFYLGKTSFR